MFGVTTPGVMRIREQLEDNGFEVVTFHAVGEGAGMEHLVDTGAIDALIDYTLPEIINHWNKGIFDPGCERMEAAVRTGIPLVVVPGAAECFNFGARDTIPAEFDTDERNIIIHNPNITSLLATPDEMRGSASTSPTTSTCAPGPKAVALPLNGLDNYFKEGSQWHGVDVSPLLDAIRATLDPDVEVVEMDNNINDTAFADAVTSCSSSSGSSGGRPGSRWPPRRPPAEPTHPSPRRDAASRAASRRVACPDPEASMTQRLFLLRHGEVTSHRGDVPVTEEGLQTAVEVGRRLAGRADGAIRVISGETRRTRDTAAAVARGAREAGAEVREDGVAFALRNPDLYLAGVRVDMVSSEEAFAAQIPGFTEADVAKVAFFTEWLTVPDRVGWCGGAPSPGGRRRGGRRPHPHVRRQPRRPEDDTAFTVAVTHSPCCAPARRGHRR